MPTLEKIAHRAAWTADELRQHSAQWIYPLSAADLAELDAAHQQIKSNGLTVPNFGKADFPIPGLMNRLATFKNELDSGLGIMLLKGFPVERYTKDEASAIFWGIGMHVGKPWEQNNRGHLLGDIIDEGRNPLTDTSARGYQSTVALEFHTDGADHVALLCLKQAPEGGEFSVTSAIAVFNHLVATQPDVAQHLLDTSFCYDWRDEQAPGKSPFHESRLFQRIPDGIGCLALTSYIRSAQRHPGARRLTATDLAALDAFDAATRTPELVFQFKKAPGDMAFLNNHFHVHARTAFQDAPDPKERRHLRRLWLESAAWTGRRPAGMQNIFDMARSAWAKPDPTVQMWDAA